MNKVYFEFYGCAANKFDLEVMLGILSKAGYSFSSTPEKAEILLIHTCGVKKATEDKILQRLTALSKLNKPLIVSGCLPKIDLNNLMKSSPNAVFMDPYSIDKILAAIEASKTLSKKFFFTSQPLIKLSFPKIRLNKYIEIIQIAEGCLGSCAYCCTRFARGKLYSYSIEDILTKVKEALKNGVVEVWLTAQDVGAYGKDLGVNLINLLNEIIDLPYEFRVRIGMMNPSYALEMIDELKNIYKNEKIFKFAHIPVQSGSNKILKDMNRFYTVEEFKEVVKELKDEIKNLSIATDIIVGYPTETSEDFKLTLNLLNEIKPDVTNISKFTYRPRTEASLLKQLPSKIVAERSRFLSKISSKITLEKNLSFIGKTESIIVSEQSSRGTYIGRTLNYKKVLIASDENLLGLKLNVKIVSAYERYLIGELL
ncbi:tRNA (N(6)-L-threonylcarbamoyladenosine(37)-C(2))-methylthiotransferase [Candidatus Bathyarchaeota archaeon]|nr:tRNA (N(6)-L-threonylcarbamoyladenosine(37)-C(2))-methylthiotransferase [Candidatus Bathyarchaeota archaeon]